MSRDQKKHSPTHTHEEEKEGFAQTTRSASSQHTTKVGQLKLTASAFMDQYACSPGHSIYCYAKLTASFINFLHYCSSSSGLHGAGKDNRGRRTDNPSGRHPIRTIGAPTSIILILCRMPFLLQPCQFITAWNRNQITLDCILTYSIYWFTGSKTFLSQL